MSDDFSTPIYDAPVATASVAPAAPSHTTDLNDLNLSSERLDTNEHLDAYAAPAPIDDGTYTVKIKRLDTKDGRPFTKKVIDNGKYAGMETFFTQHEASVIDVTGRNDGRKLYDRYVSSAYDRNNARPIIAVLQSFGLKVGAQASNAELWQMYDRATKGEPTIRVMTVWEAQLPQDIAEEYKRPENKARKIYAPRVLGQDKFPLAEDGKSRKPEMWVDVSNLKGDEPHPITGKVGPAVRLATAQARISRYLPLK